MGHDCGQRSLILFFSIHQMQNLNLEHYLASKTTNVLWKEIKKEKKKKERYYYYITKKETYFLFIPFQSWRMKVGRQPLEDPSSQETAGRDFWIRCEYNLQWSRVRVCLLSPATSETILLTVKHWTQTKWLGYEYWPLLAFQPNWPKYLPHGLPVNRNPSWHF